MREGEWEDALSDLPFAGMQASRREEGGGRDREGSVVRVQREEVRQTPGRG